MKNRETHFDNNDSFGKRAEAVVSSYLSSHGRVIPKESEWSADVTVHFGVHGIHKFGVECIRKWAGESYPREYPVYNLLTHKRARKMLNREEPFLFVVSSCLEYFMFYTPSCVPANVGNYRPRGKLMTKDGGSFRRGGQDDPLMVMPCPWGFDGEETAFRVPLKTPRKFSDETTIDPASLCKRLVWTGPAPSNIKQ